MQSFSEILDILARNREWLFQGLGITVLGILAWFGKAIWSWLRTRFGSQDSALPIQSNVPPSSREIGQRIQTAIDLMNEYRKIDLIHLSDLARALNLPGPATLEAVVAGIEAPPFALIDAFAKRFHISADWLQSGRGQPFASRGPGHLFAEEYFEGIIQDRPECVYLVRNSAGDGEAVIVLCYDDLQYTALPSVWNISDIVGGTGASQLLSFYEFSRKLSAHEPHISILGRELPPAQMRRLIEGALHPGIVASSMPLSHWWDDLTDLDSKWTNPDQLAELYGENFLRAQQIIRSKLVARDSRD